ncbi:MAG: hypothetical protein K8963_11010, partial [Proteobacteria bacterium]|nr:hypothetical protein [Pseudomonadota bacterium]
LTAPPATLDRPPRTPLAIKSAGTACFPAPLTLQLSQHLLHTETLMTLMPSITEGVLRCLYTNAPRTVGHCWPHSSPIAL